jgi:hypothetical protein
MPTNLIRSLLVSTLVLGSFGTLADAAPPKEVAEIRFECEVPRVGKDRCGDANRNVRLGPAERLTVQVDKIMPAGPCVTFYVVHAVSGEQLRALPRICQPDGAGTPAWTNPEDEPVDVYMNVSSSTVTTTLVVEGRYRIDRP